MRGVLRLWTDEEAEAFLAAGQLETPHPFSPPCVSPPTTLS
jgi:hypothetical protein